MALVRHLQRYLLLVATALALFVSPCYAQSGAPGSPESALPAGTPSPVDGGGNGATAIAPAPGSIGEALLKVLNGFKSFRSGLVAGAVSLSSSLNTEAGKIAFGLGVIALTLAAIQFAATSDPTTAWTGLLEAFLVLGIFSTLFVSYTAFAPGLYEWFQSLADKISGTRASNPAFVLASIAGSFIDSFTKSIGAAKWYDIAGVLFASFLLVFAFAFCAIAALLYSFFIALGEIQVAIGIVIGPIAVSLGFFEYTRRFFSSWLDFMISGSMYVVVAAIMGKLVASALTSSLDTVSTVGTAAPASAAYACGVAIFMIFVALEIPKIAGAIFGSGGGASGGGVIRLATKLATKGLK